MPTSTYILDRLRSMDWLVILLVFLLVFVGLVSIKSATAENESITIKKNFQRQIIWVLIGALMFFAASMVSFRWLHAVSYLALAAGFLFVLATYIPSVSGGVSRRWISLGFLNVQPSEFMKVFLILGLARVVTDHIKSLGRWQSLVVPFTVVGIATLLVLRQPDLGTATVYPAVLFPMLFWAGVPLFFLFSIVAPFISLITAMNFFAFLLWIILMVLVLWLSKRSLTVIVLTFLLNVSVGTATPYMWNNYLKPYQRQRILTFVNKQLDPKGSGYQVLQSTTAIGSGGFYGKGYRQGTQTQLKFLPEQHTDFIFSLIGEEFGFVGVVIILSGFLILILRTLRIASSIKNQYESLVLIGISSALIYQIFINIAMTTGGVPVTGLPLPFLSYGGSSLISTMLLVGLIAGASADNKR